MTIEKLLLKQYDDGVIKGLELACEGIDEAIKFHKIEGYSKNCLLEVQRVYLKSIVRIGNLK